MNNPRDWVASLLLAVENRKPFFVGALFLLFFIFATSSAFFALQATPFDFFRLKHLDEKFQALIGIALIASTIEIVLFAALLLGPLFWGLARAWYNAPFKAYRRLPREEQAICLFFFIKHSRLLWLWRDNFHVLALNEKGVIRAISSSGERSRYEISEPFWRVLGPGAESLLKEFDAESEELVTAGRMVKTAKPGEHSWMST